MKGTDVLMVVAVIAVLLAGVNLMITVNKINDYKVLTGFAADTGTANLTIESNAEVNFTTDIVDWNTGFVPIGAGSCELDTLGNSNCTNFDTVGTGLILENIGNEDVYVNLSSSKDADSFIGGTTPDFEWNISENDTAQACDSGLGPTVFSDVNTTPNAQICANFTANPSTADELLIDLRVVIPEDAVAEAKGTVITATAFTAV